MDTARFFGIGLSVLFGFARWRFPAVPRFIASSGMAVGFGLMLWSAMPFVRSGPAALAIASFVGLVCAFEWQLSAPATASPPVPNGSSPHPGALPHRGPLASAEPTPSKPLKNDGHRPNPVDHIAQKSEALGNETVGMDVAGNGQGSPAADIISNGTVEHPSLGAEIRATAPAGGNVTGLRVTQTGPGTGMRIVQTGPGVGMRVVVSNGPDDKK